MTAVLPAMQELARRILAIEAARAKAAGTEVDVTAQVCEKLRVPLAKLAGPAGFSSLLSRALALAKAEVPSLRVVQVRPDGSLAGFEGITPSHDAGLETDRVVLVIRLLGLLATFIGEPLTRRLVCDVWPDASTESTDLKREERI